MNVNAMCVFMATVQILTDPTDVFVTRTTTAPTVTKVSN